jgi:hypothetical protein
MSVAGASGLPGRAGLSGVQSGAPAFGGPRLLTDVALTVERRLPIPGDLTVTEGQIVEPSTVLATAVNAPSRLHVIELARAFDRILDPAEARAALLVETGQVVRAGEPLARVSRGTWVGREVAEAGSPADGVVEFISLSRAQIVIRATADTKEERIALPVAHALAVEPAELPLYALCRPGQAVSLGDVLARTGSLRPISGEYRSPVSGVVESVSRLSGNITIVREIEPLALLAYMAGRVVRLLPGYGAVIAAHGHRVLGILGLGGKGWGPLTPVGEPAADGRAVVLSASAIHSGLRGAIVVAPGAVNASALAACRAAGIRGLVCGSARASDLAEFIGRPLAAEIVTGPGALRAGPGHAATGGVGPGGAHEGGGAAATTDGDADAGAGLGESGMPVIVTEGFGQLPMDRLTWDLLAQHRGRTVSIDGQTQIRAGVVRPSVMIPMWPAGREAQAPSAGSHERGFAALPELEVGQRVRIVRQPYFGLWGRVLVPPGGLVRLETEVEARVLTVALDDGRVVRVAEANVEI